MVAMVLSLKLNVIELQYLDMCFIICHYIEIIKKKKKKKRALFEKHVIISVITILVISLLIVKDLEVKFSIIVA